MSMTMNTPALTTSAPRLSLRLWIARATAWRALARQRADLAALDDRALKDIGVTPDAAAREAQRPFWDAPVFWCD